MNQIKIFNIDDFDSINQNLVLDASAGTGKTYSVTEIVKNMLEKQKNKKEFLRKILIVTYTEKATGELKNRIRKELENKYINDTFEINDFNIFTIHSFCQNSIQEFGIEAKIPLGLNVVDENIYLNKFLDEYIRKGNLLKDIIICKTVCDKVNVNTFKKYLYSAMSNCYLDRNFDDVPSIVSIDYSPDLTSAKIAFDCVRAGSKETLLDEINKMLAGDPYNVNGDFTEFFKNYEIIKNSNDPDTKLIADNIEKRINGNNGKIVPKEKWPINQDEIDAVDYFSRIHNKQYKKNFVDFNTYLSATPDAKRYYDILKNSSDSKCKEAAKCLEDNFLFDSSSGKYKVMFAGFKSIRKWPETKEELGALNYVYKYIDSTKKRDKDGIVGALYMYLINKYIKEIYKEYCHDKIVNKNQTFNDLLRTVREELTKDKSIFKEKLKEKYDYAIIDEFQDTNQIQFDIFKSIFMEDNNHHIIVVGDPKQSIYSFQGADLNVYFKAKDDIANNSNSSDVIQRLDTNWRSSSDMVNSCNKFFGNICGEKFFSDDRIDFTDSKPCHVNRYAKYKGKEIPALWVGTGDNPIEIKVEDYAELVVKKIIDYCTYDGAETRLQISRDDDDNSSNNVTFKDFTILARTRSEFGPIERVLKKYGVPYVKYKDTGLFRTRECSHWIALLSALNVTDYTGYNRKVFKKALFTDFFGVSLKDMNDEVYNSDSSKEMETMLKWKLIAKERKWEKLIDSIMDDSNILARLRDLDKIQSVSIYKQIADYCITYLCNNHTITDLIVSLDNLSSGSSDEVDNNTVAIGSDFDAVKLMTIHASKGLQFPIVISVAGFRNAYFGAVTGITSNQNKNRVLTFDVKKSKQDSVNEWERLIYVAYTRAKVLMFIPLYLPYKQTTDYYYDILHDKTKRYIESYQANRLKDDVKIVDLNAVKSILDKNKIVDNTNEEKQLDKIKKTLHYGILNNKKSFKHAYSTLKPNKNDILDTSDEEQLDREGEETIESLAEFDSNSKAIESNYDESKTPIQIPDKFPKGKEIGSALHEVFENTTFSNFDINKFDSNKTELLETIKRSLEHYKFKSDNSVFNDYIITMVRNVLNADLPIIQGNHVKNGSFKLSSILDDNKKAEMEFNFNVTNKARFRNYFNGFIDLLFERDGYYSVLDWKSDGLNNVDLQSYSNFTDLKTHTNNHYSIQRVLYSYCLIKWLNEQYGENSLEETFKKHFGGVYYVYIRGCNEDCYNGIYSQTWESFAELEAAFNKIIIDFNLANKSDMED